MADIMTMRIARVLAKGAAGPPAEAAIEQARAILIAMRDPSRGIERAFGSLPDENRYTWQTMIDAALAEQFDGT